MLKRILLAIAALIVLLVGAMAFYVADIRPESLRVDELPQSAIHEGRAMLGTMTRAHGSKTWSGYQVMDLTFTDAWTGMAEGMAIWPSATQQVSGQFARGSWTSRVLMLDGPAKGTLWGIQSWKTWTAKPEGQPVFAPDANIEFSLPTMQYFFEMPLRIDSASIVANAGDASIDGRNHHRVYATWGTAEPNREHDQYLLWIDSKTYLLTRVDYTVRDFGGVATGRATYTDYRDVGGVKLAHRITITAPMPGGFEPQIHEMTIQQAAWDTVPPTALRPDPSLPAEGESKPPQS